METTKWCKMHGNFLLDDAHAYRKSLLKSVQIAGGVTAFNYIIFVKIWQWFPTKNLLSNSTCSKMLFKMWKTQNDLCSELYSSRRVCLRFNTQYTMCLVLDLLHRDTFSCKEIQLYIWNSYLSVKMSLVFYRKSSYSKYRVVFCGTSKFNVSHLIA